MSASVSGRRFLRFLVIVVIVLAALAVLTIVILTAVGAFTGSESGTGAGPRGVVLARAQNSQTWPSHPPL